MKKEEINDLIIDILIEDGPDGHIDGHDVITAFIIELMKGKGKEWADEYKEFNKRKIRL